jgi:hypothetical protein
LPDIRHYAASLVHTILSVENSVSIVMKHFRLDKRVYLYAISCISAVILIFFFAASTTAGNAGPVPNMNLTKEQIKKLDKLIKKLNAEQFEIVSKINEKFSVIGQDLKKEDRFDTASKNRTGSLNFSRQVKNISLHYGDLLRLRVKYILKAKDILNDRQKSRLISALLDFDIDTPDDFSYYLKLDLPTLMLDLTKDQKKNLLKYKTDMDIRDLQLELEMNYKLLDLQDDVRAVTQNSKSVNKIIGDITDLGAKLIDNRMNYILKARGVLTLDQKKKLLQMILKM